MDLWVRSQDRKNLIRINGLRVVENFIQIRGEGAGILNAGNYATKERALEVLDDIQKFITIKNARHYITCEEDDISVKNEILNNMTKIYEMPKE